jgi:ribonucleoside-diphosphate reductase beta chain
MGLFDAQTARKPDNYPWAEDYIRAIWEGFWTPDEFKFIGDVADFKNSLSEQERDVLTRTLSAIGQIEIAVKTFWARLGDNLPHPSIQDLGFAMSNSEVIHNKAYEKLLEVLKMEDIFEKNLNEPVVAGRVNYLKKYNERRFEDDRKQYIYSIILFTLFVENVSLFSQFYIIMHMNRKNGYMKDTAQQVQYTRNEELLHANVGIKVIQTLREEYPELFDAEMEDLIMHQCFGALIAEEKVLSWILQGYSEGDTLSEEVVLEFLKKRMADSLKECGFETLPFSLNKELLAKSYWFDEALHGDTMTDFFNKRPVDYAKGTAITEDDLF